MRLLFLREQKKNYHVRVERSFKIFGLRMNSRFVDYLFLKDDKKWVRASNKRKVNAVKKVQLDRWLKNHKRFFEGVEHQSR